MVERRFQVFISSTFDDLSQEREVVWRRLIDHNYIVAGMEHFPAASDAPFEYIKPLIESSDYFVLIVGARYGSCPPQGSSSYTESEFDHAVQHNVPVLVFPLAPDQLNARTKVDVDQDKQARLHAFVSRASTGRMVRHWSSSDDLAAIVIQALSFEEKRNARPGWIRSAGIDLTALLAENAELKRAQADAATAQQRAADDVSTLNALKTEMAKKRVAIYDYGSESSLEIELTISDVLYNMPVAGDVNRDEIITGLDTAIAEHGERIYSRVGSYSGFVDEMILVLQQFRAIDVHAGIGVAHMRPGPNWMIAHRIARGMD